MVDIDNRIYNILIDYNIDFILSNSSTKISDKEYHAVMNDFFMSHGV